VVVARLVDVEAAPRAARGDGGGCKERGRDGEHVGAVHAADAEAGATRGSSPTPRDRHVARGPCGPRRPRRAERRVAMTRCRAPRPRAALLATLSAGMPARTTVELPKELAAAFARLVLRIEVTATRTDTFEDLADTGSSPQAIDAPFSEQERRNIAALL